jgi:hypothetical protein
LGRFWGPAAYPLAHPWANENRPEGLSLGAVAGKCFLALTRQPSDRSRQPQAARPGSCTRLVWAHAVPSYIDGRSLPRVRAIVFPGISVRYGGGHSPPGRALAGTAGLGVPPLASRPARPRHVDVGHEDLAAAGRHHLRFRHAAPFGRRPDHRRLWRDAASNIAAARARRRSSGQVTLAGAGWPAPVPRHPRQPRGVPPASAPRCPGIRPNGINGTSMPPERHQCPIDVVSRPRMLAANSMPRTINRTWPGKGRTITYGDRAPVFRESRRVTCGRLVNKPVDNRRDVRITGGILWRTCGREKRRNEFPGDPCGDPCGGSRNTSPPETGTIWGKLRNVRMAGKPEVRAGIRPWRAARGAGKAGRLADAGKPADAGARPSPGAGGCQVTGGCR